MEAKWKNLKKYFFTTLLVLISLLIFAPGVLADEFVVTSPTQADKVKSWLAGLNSEEEHTLILKSDLYLDGTDPTGDPGDPGEYLKNSLVIKDGVSVTFESGDTEPHSIIRKGNFTYSLIYVAYVAKNSDPDDKIGASLTLTNINIDGNTESYGEINTNGCGINVHPYGILNIEKGTTILNHTSTPDGAAIINALNGTVNMTDGLIKNNKSSINGGGISNSGTFNMTGGIIEDNIAKKGAGVHNIGTFNLGVKNDDDTYSGEGIIRKNTANVGPIADDDKNYRLGGGVYNEKVFNLYSGTITDNIIEIDEKNWKDEFDLEATGYGAGVYNAASGAQASSPTFTMEGGSITGNHITLERDGKNIKGHGAGVYNAGAVIEDAKGGTFKMKGGEISGNYIETKLEGDNLTAENFGSGVYNAGTLVPTATNGTFIMAGGEISENYIKSTLAGKNLTAKNFGGGVYNASSPNENSANDEFGTFSMKGGSITDNKAEYGAGVYNDDVTKGVFTMAGGEINGNGGTATHFGGGVYNKNIFDMSGGSIIGNNATGSGGGVHNAEKGTFTMTGGDISKDNRAEHGGGVYNAGSFTMDKQENGSSGSITGNSNTTTNGMGGGIYNTAVAELTMNAGEISKNTASKGGGVFNDCSPGFPSESYGKFTMNGGSIFGNTATKDGGGVYNMGDFGLSSGTIGHDDPANGNTAAKGGGVHNSGIFNMNTGTISNNTAEWGAGVFNHGDGINTLVAAEATFIMKDGDISNNTIKIGNEDISAQGRGAGVYNASQAVTDQNEIPTEVGGFTMKGGKISGNSIETSVEVTNSNEGLTAQSYGGGVYNYGDAGYSATFKKSSGSISGNTVHAKVINETSNQNQISESLGAGVYNGGTFHMNDENADATTGISENKATSGGEGNNIKNIAKGGGVYNGEFAEFKFTKGEISSNEALQGGGVFNQSTFTMDGGSITNNTAQNGGGVYITQSATLNMSGGGITKNNETTTDGRGHDAYLDVGAVINLNGDNKAITLGTSTDRGICLYYADNMLNALINIKGELVSDSKIFVERHASWSAGSVVAQQFESGDANGINAARFNPIADNNNHYFRVVPKGTDYVLASAPTIQILKGNAKEPWRQAGRKFTLYKGNSSTNITVTTDVAGFAALPENLPNDTYQIYDSSSVEGGGINTGVEIEINNDSPNARVQYYDLTLTAAFSGEATSNTLTAKYSGATNSTPLITLEAKDPQTPATGTIAVLEGTDGEGYNYRNIELTSVGSGAPGVPLGYWWGESENASHNSSTTLGAIKKDDSYKSVVEGSNTHLNILKDNAAWDDHKLAVTLPYGDDKKFIGLQNVDRADQFDFFFGTSTDTAFNMRVNGVDTGQTLDRGATLDINFFTLDYAIEKEEGKAKGSTISATYDDLIISKNGQTKMGGDVVSDDILLGLGKLVVTAEGKNAKYYLYDWSINGNPLQGETGATLVLENYGSTSETTGNIACTITGTNNDGTIEIFKDGKSWDNLADFTDVITLKKGNKEFTTKTITDNKLIFPLYGVIGNLEIWVNGNNTGQTVKVDGAASLDYYTMEFAAATAPIAQNGSIEATYNGAKILNGAVVLSGGTLEMTAKAEGADFYEYAWSEGATPLKETGATLTVENVNGRRNYLCTITGLKRYPTITDFNPIVTPGQDAVLVIEGPFSDLVDLEINGESQTLEGLGTDHIKIIGPDGTVRGEITGTGNNTVVTLYPEYLDTLPNGVYEVKVRFKDGIAIGNLTIERPAPGPEPTPSDNPTTGDTSDVGTWCLLLGLSVVLVLVMRRKLIIKN